MKKVWTLLSIVFANHIATSFVSREKRGSGPTNIPLTDADKMAIVQHHNDLRRLSDSSNMRYMTWDSELTLLAQEYTQKCHFAHNKARKHSRGWSVGENIFASSGKLLSSNVNKAVQAWYDEIKYFTFSTRTCTPYKMCGHYTQIVWANTYKIGCALVNCEYLTGVNWNSGGSMFLCNYATTGNIVSGANRKLLSVFEKGSACSKCDANDYCRDYLCANSERDFIEEDFSNEDAQDRDNRNGFIAAIIVLSVIVLSLLVFIVYRERVRLSVKLGLWRTEPNNSMKFSNQNTPVPSAHNTPRQSITGLHGIHRLTTADIGTPVEMLKASERGWQSAPTTPKHGYVKGTSTPPKMPPPVPPPPLQKK